jgi:hypothetical protein
MFLSHIDIKNQYWFFHVCKAKSYIQLRLYMYIHMIKLLQRSVKNFNVQLANHNLLFVRNHLKYISLSCWYCIIWPTTSITFHLLVIVAHKISIYFLKLIKNIFYWFCIWWLKEIYRNLTTWNHLNNVCRRSD